MAAKAPAFWRVRGARAGLLLPLALLFGALARLRRRWLRPQRIAVPVIVVGNVAVGGSGKTPVVEWLVQLLTAAGYRPGVISRGHGGRIDGVAQVPVDGDPGLFGDEPVLLARQCGCPLVVGRDRPAAARELLRLHPQCNLIVADDGMQHYRLARDIEIAVVDEATLGNRFLLPSGPLREPLCRLAEVDLVIAHGPLSSHVRRHLQQVPVFSMQLQGSELHNLRDPAQRCELAALAGQTAHAVAGIGRPERFFDQLAASGIDVRPHAFPDHHHFRPQDIAFGDGLPVLMTAKDAVKCRAFASTQCWELPVRAHIGSGAAERILEKLDNGRATA